MAAISVGKFAFFVRNRCSQDGIYGNAEITTVAEHNGTLNNIFHPSLLRAGEFDGNDITLFVQLRDKWRDVQAIHIIADLTPLATITISSKASAAGSYATRATLTLGTQDTSIAGLFTSGGAEAAEDRIDPVVPIYSFYLDASTQSTVAGHALWRLQLDDPGRAATASIAVQALYFGPITQLLTLPGDGVPTTFIKTFEQEGSVTRLNGAPLSNPTPVLQRFQFDTIARTQAEIAGLQYDFTRLGMRRPFFFALRPEQGTILDSTNYREKWLTIYGLFAAASSVERVAGAGDMVRVRANILESR